ncbi:MAG: hypothetical protein Q9157_000039 [Trypethelium eluteriae]
MAPFFAYFFLAAQASLLALAQDEPYSTDYDYYNGDSSYNDGDTNYYDGDSNYGSSDSATCYFPAGNIAYGNVPCNPDGEVSTCCGDVSKCLANGLCAVGDTSDGLGGFLNSGVEFARGGCTDPTWQDPACFQHCLSSQPGSPDSNGAAVFECGSEGYANPANYCCENGIDAKTACCATSSLIFELGPGTYGSMSPATSPASASYPAPTITTTATSDQTYTVPSTKSVGSVVPVMTGNSSPIVSVPTPQPSNGTAPIASVQTSSFRASNATATTARPSAFTGAADNIHVSPIGCIAIALAALGCL